LSTWWHRRGGVNVVVSTWWCQHGGVDLAVVDLAAVVVVPHLAGFIMGTEKRKGGFTHLALPHGTRWGWSVIVVDVEVAWGSEVDAGGVVVVVVSSTWRGGGGGWSST